MRVHIKKSIASGTISAPGSKSITIRMLIGAALSKTESTIKNVDLCEDVVCAMECLKAMGAEIVYKEKERCFIVIKGIDFDKENVELYIMESASTFRFLVPLASLFTHKVKFHLGEQLIKRPQKGFVELFNNVVEVGKEFEVESQIVAKNYHLNDTTSSQYVTGLLFALPLLKDNSTIYLSENFLSLDYIHMTINCLKRFGIVIKPEGRLKFTIPGNQKYHGVTTEVEGDYSAIANMIVLGAINSNGIVINNLTPPAISLQPDKRIAEIIASMNGVLYCEGNSMIVKPSKLKTFDVDLNRCIDLGPLLIGLGSIVDGISVLHNTKRLEYKESNRKESMYEELIKLNSYLEQNHDLYKMYGGINSRGGVIVDCHNDHRVCMAMSIIATMYENGLYIDGCECVNKSYPNFFNDLRSLGIKVEEC